MKEGEIHPPVRAGQSLPGPGGSNKGQSIQRDLIPNLVSRWLLEILVILESKRGLRLGSCRIISFRVVPRYYICPSCILEFFC